MREGNCPAERKRVANLEEKMVDKRGEDDYT